MTSQHSNGETQVPNDLRQRMRLEILAELSSSAGLGQGRLSLEALYLLPKEFVEGYADLFHKALREGIGKEGIEFGGGKTDENVVKRIDGKHRGKKIGAGGGGGGAKKYRTYWSVRSEQALAAKEALDREILRAVRDAHGNAKDPGRGGNARCDGVGCRKFVKKHWKYCPSCGKKVSTAEQV